MKQNQFYNTLITSHLVGIPKKDNTRGIERESAFFSFKEML